MNYKIEVTPNFEKSFKKLTKKYRSLKTDLSTFIETLKINPKQGTALGNSCFKIRLAITSKSKGKSGGARMITFVYDAGETLYLLSIYDKSEKADLSDKELQHLLKLIGVK